jgi:hypothetical protein
MELRELKQLQEENRQLKKLVADLSLDKKRCLHDYVNSNELCFYNSFCKILCLYLKIKKLILYYKSVLTALIKNLAKHLKMMILN